MQLGSTGSTSLLLWPIQRPKMKSKSAEGVATCRRYPIDNRFSGTKVVLFRVDPRQFTAYRPTA